MDFKIKSCDDCLFCMENDCGPGYTCELKMKIIQEQAASEKRHYSNEEYYETQIKQTKKWKPIDPEWCPLKKESVTIGF